MKVGDLVLPMRFFCDMREDAGCRIEDAGCRMQDEGTVYFTWSFVLVAMRRMGHVR